LLFLPLISADAVIRKGNCTPDETCLFSIYRQNDSHVGQCNYYNYSVCYPYQKVVVLRNGTCNNDENCILSQYKPNNSHVAKCNYYNYSLCINENSNFYLTTECNGQHRIITFYNQKDSHVGSLGYYNYTLCANEFAGGTFYRTRIKEIIEEGIEEPSKFFKWFLFITFLIILIYKRRKKKKKLMEKKRKNTTETFINTNLLNNL